MLSLNYNPNNFKGRNRRLFLEWQKIAKLCSNRKDIQVEIKGRNTDGLPVKYEVIYHIKSICSVEKIEDLENPAILNRPVFHDSFVMSINLPNKFPAIDAPPEFRFKDKNEKGEILPTPWHPNIRFFGSFKGMVCLNRTDTFTDLAYGILRVADYLCYQRYHAEVQPPFPEDLSVAKWIREQAEPNRWLEVFEKCHDPRKELKIERKLSLSDATSNEEIFIPQI